MAEGIRENALKVNTIEVVLRHQVRHGLDKGGAILSRTNTCGKIPGACPTAYGHKGFHILNVKLAAKRLRQQADKNRTDIHSSLLPLRIRELILEKTC